MKFNKSYSVAASVMLAASAVLPLSACSGSNSSTSAVDSDTISEIVEEQSDSALTPDSILAQAAGKTVADVKGTDSGLRYIVVEEGTGNNPSATDEVTVYYTGKLTDGTVFDSTSLHGNEPISFPLNRVIPGWTEGVGLMKEGGKYIFYIPSELAYGSRGVPGTIPPDSPLIFEVELVKINK